MATTIPHDHRRSTCRVALGVARAAGVVARSGRAIFGRPKDRVPAFLAG
ncbi:MAG: hypothetical protein U0Q21_13745 [Dermatophilaceae bacterium]